MSKKGDLNEEKIPLTPGGRLYNEEKKDVEKGKTSPSRSTKVSPRSSSSRDLDETTKQFRESLEYVKKHFQTYQSSGDKKKEHKLVPCVHFGDVCFEDEIHRKAKVSERGRVTFALKMKYTERLR